MTIEQLQNNLQTLDTLTNIVNNLSQKTKTEKKLTVFYENLSYLIDKMRNNFTDYYHYNNLDELDSYINNIEQFKKIWKISIEQKPFYYDLQSENNKIKYQLKKIKSNLQNLNKKQKNTFHKLPKEQQYTQGVA